MLRAIRRLFGGTPSLQQGENAATSDSHKQMFDRLYEAGFFIWAADPESSLMAAKDSAEPFQDVDGRSFRFDPEELAEGGIGSFIERCKPVLKRVNVVVDAIEDLIDRSYSVIINGNEYQVYTETQLESDNIWLLATVGMQRIMNDLLRDAGANERLYICPIDANSQTAVFLSPVHFEITERSQALSDWTHPQLLSAEAK